MDEPLQRTVEGLREGHREAWGQFYEMYAEPLWREVARLSGGGSADVADIVQDVFLSAATSARRYDPKLGSLWTWLMGIARKRVALHWRKRAALTDGARRWWAMQNGQTRQWLTGEGDAPAMVLQSKEMAALVRLTLLELPVDYQVVLTRRHLDGVSAPQIAAEVGDTGDAVRARLVRAREAFRKVFIQVAGPNAATSEGENRNE